MIKYSSWNKPYLPSSGIAWLTNFLESGCKEVTAGYLKHL